MAFQPERNATRNFPIHGFQVHGFKVLCCFRQPLLAIAFVIALGNLALADTYYVDDDGLDHPNPDYNDIQEAVDAASDRDTIIVCAGTYQYSGNQLLTDAVVFIDKPLSLVADTTNGDVLIDGQNWRRCLTLLGEDYDTQTGYDSSGNYHSPRKYEIRVEGFKIINGLAWTIQGLNSEDGGGIYVEGNVRIDDCVISNCHANRNGGGIAVFNPDLANASTNLEGYNDNPFTWVRIDDCTVENCSANGDGGGIYNWESLALLRSAQINLNFSSERGGGFAAHHWLVPTARTELGDWTLQNTTELWANVAVGDGGAVFVEGNAGKVEIVGVEIVGNRTRAGNGGGMCLFNVRANHKRITLTENDADQAAGGSGGNGGGLFVDNSTFDCMYWALPQFLCQKNTAEARGGGVFAIDSNIDVLDGLFEENQSLGKGGAVAAISCGQVDFTDATFLENDGHLAGALYLKNSSGVLDHCSILFNRGWLNGGWNGAAVVVDGASADLTIGDSNFWQNEKKRIQRKNSGSLSDNGGNIVSSTAVP